jgi:hypothetical protein
MRMYNLYTKKDIADTLDDYGMKNCRIEENPPNEVKVILPKVGWWRFLKRRKMRKCIETIRQAMPATIYFTWSMEKL